MLKNYIKIAVKVLLRRKFFTSISLFGVSFTLMVLMIITAFGEHLFGKQSPEVHKDRTLGAYRIKAGGYHVMPGYKFLINHVKDMPFAEKVAIHSVPLPKVTYYEGKRIDSFLKRTDGTYWEIMQFDFIEGGPFTQQDNDNANFVCVINEKTKKDFFGNDPALGNFIQVEGINHRVVGVVPNVSLLRYLDPFADIWVPITTNPDKRYMDEYMGFFQALILARSSDDFDLLRSEYKSIVEQVEWPEPIADVEVEMGLDTSFEMFCRLAGGDSDPNPPLVLSVLFIFMVLFMILPTLNLVNLNVSRIMERASEVGIRKAFGASSRTLIWQFIVENVILTFLGGFIGLIGSVIILSMINGSGLIPYANLAINLKVFVYGILITLFFGIFSGVIPARRMAKMHPVYALRGEN
ncbi:MAG: FtsX-like permease family protein [bacterium]|nr:FtsX-like permease family protein [bacterium]